MDYTRRRAGLRELLAPGSSYVSNDPVSVRYLTGFTGSSGAILLEPERVTLVTDGRYRDQATDECPDVNLVVDRAGIAAIGRLIAERSSAMVTVASSMTHAQVMSLMAAAREVRVADEDPVSRLRQIKDDEERSALRTACAITAGALMDLARGIRVGDREVDLARRLEAGFARRGAEDRAFATIVATGAHSAIPHHRPTDTPVRPGDLLVIDCGARVDGYHADMTRTFVVGAEPEEWQRVIFDIVHKAAAAGRAAVRDGAACSSVDAVARGLIAESGYADNFSHGTGHAVGLVIHEAPMLTGESLGTLAAGMAVTVEPGIYLPSRGGVRIEDTLEVTRDGAVVLTEAPRALERVG